MSAATEAQLDGVLDKTLATQPLVKPQFREQLDRALLKHTGTNPLLDVLAVTILKHDRLDPAPMQKMRQQKPRRAAPDDTHLRAHANECKRVASCNPTSNRQRLIESPRTARRDE